MPGINLSQSVPTEEQKELHRIPASSKVLYGILLLFVIVGSLYGGLYYYSSDYDKKQAAIQADIQRVKTSYASESMLRAAKFSIKSDAILKERMLPDVSPTDELKVVSTNILPDIILQSYENDFSKNLVKISGEASALFRVAQQMKVFRESGNFSEVTLSGPLSRDDAGVITFSIDLVKTIGQKHN